MILCKNTQIVELLTADEAHVNAQDQNSRTALIYAADRGHTDIVELLIPNGAHVDT